MSKRVNLPISAVRVLNKQKTIVFKKNTAKVSQFTPFMVYFRKHSWQDWRLGCPIYAPVDLAEVYTLSLLYLSGIMRNITAIDQPLPPSKSRQFILFIGVFSCQSRTSLVAANSTLQAEDFYTFLVTTCQTTADARFRTPALTPGTCWKCAEIDIYSHLQTLSKEVFIKADYAYSALETIFFV